jgi:hypothetical protein
MLLGSGLCAMREPRLPRIPPAIECPVLLFTYFCQIKSNFPPHARQAKLGLKLSVLCTLEGIVWQAVKLKQQTIRIEAMEYGPDPDGSHNSLGVHTIPGFWRPGALLMPVFALFFRSRSPSP